MRPLGVTIIAYLHWIRGLVYAFGAIMLLEATRLGGRLMSAITNDTFLARFTSHVGRAMGYGLLIFAMFWIILGVGMWMRKNWARSMTLVFALIWAVFEIVKVVSVPTPWRIFRLAVDALIVLYLLLPGVKRAFN